MRNIAGAVLAAALALASALPARAQERTLEIRELNAQIVVLRSGSVRVTERIVVHFSGSWNGIYRTIPVQYETPQGLDYTLRLQLESVTDGSGNTLRHDVERDGGDRRIRMWVPDAHDATRTVVLTYRIANALRFFEEHDELYWNVTGDRWDYPIQQVTAEILLPEDVAGIRTASFLGARGATESAAVEQLGTSTIFRSTRPTGFREGLTVVVGWNPGVIERPTQTEKVASLFASNSMLLAPIVAFIVMLLLWRRWGRDPDPGSIYVRYEPPEGLTPAEAGTLIDDTPDVRDITATLVDLAVRGFLIIEEKSKEQLFGLLNSRDYEITLLQRARWMELKAHERSLLNALEKHAAGDRVLMSDLENAFYKDLPAIKKHLTSVLTDEGFYHMRPDLVRFAWIAAAVVAALALGIISTALANRYGTSGTAGFVGAGATAIVIAAFGWLMPQRTAEGARMHAWLRGFEEFLGRVEKDRLERLVDSPKAFERYLPFAMAFGVENNWARAFEGIATEPPDWYRTRDRRGFAPNLFVADLGRMSATAGSAMASAPRSSSGSSGFSGGFSGGGFGGGGGGGF